MCICLEEVTPNSISVVNLRIGDKVKITICCCGEYSGTIEWICQSYIQVDGIAIWRHIIHSIERLK